MTAHIETPAKALVTGAAGFWGRQLVATLVDLGWPVCGSSRRPKPESVQAEQWVQGDLLAPGFADRLVRGSRPTHVFHVAGTLGHGTTQLRDLVETHVLGTAALLEAVVTLEPTAWVAVASSSAVYGQAASQPIAETARMRPLTDYASSKAAVEMVTTQVRLSTGLTSCILRPFNLVGPGQDDGLLMSGLARQVAEQESVGPGVLKVGNLEPRRDYLDVRDAARAVAELAKLRCDDEVVNIGSGQSWSVQSCIDILLGLSTRTFRVEVDPQRVRSVDVADQRADVSRLRRLTGWGPSIE
ncbi:MAG TPA: NAD-dependent epimerase/dehydratase family protein, partial [Chloroflexota bacterium]